MEQILQFIKSLGYDFEPDLSTLKTWKNIKTDKYKIGYLVDQTTTHSKKIITTLVINDYLKGETFHEKFCSEPLSAAEEKNLREKFREQKEQALLEKEKQWCECAKDAEKFWQESFECECDHPYLARKGLSEFIRNHPERFRSIIKSFTRTTGEKTLRIKMHDLDGKIWGSQTIGEAGGKNYLLGQKTNGVHLTIGGNDLSRFYLCEGFATGVSIAESLDYKYPVYVCFSAGNLRNVASLLREKYERTPYIICADNDQWKPDVGNTGVRASEECISTIDGGTFTVPDFSGCDQSQRPTDYNDLYLLRGFDELRRQIGRAKITRPHVLYSLGYNNNTHYFTTSENPQIQSIQEFTTTDFLKLRPLQYWERRYANVKGVIDWNRAKNDVMRDSFAKKQFEPGKVRGRGIWVENEKLAIHLGDKLYFETHEQKDLSEIDSENIYDPRQAIDIPDKKYFEAGELQMATRILARFSWENEFDRNLFMGWMVCAPLSGMIDWRPHLCLTAQAGSGKTTLITHVVEPALRKFGPFKVENTTEAGLRQSIRTDAIPILLDEFDTNSLNEKQFNAIMSLLRASSSEGGSVRGTTSGKALKFNAKFSALLAGVNIPNFNEADRTRIAQVSLTKNHKESDWQKFKTEIVSVFNPDFSTKFFWHVFSAAKNFRLSAEIMSTFIQTIADARTGQQYGALLAGYWHFNNSDVIDTESAKKLLEDFGKWSQVKIESGDLGESDSNECFDHLMNLVVKTESDREQVTLGGLIESEGSVDVKNKFLNAYGLRLFEGEGLFVSSNNPNLRKHFRDTVWARWNMALKRLDKTKPVVKKLSGQTVRGYLIELEVRGDEF